MLKRAGDGARPVRRQVREWTPEKQTETLIAE